MAQVASRGRVRAADQLHLHPVMVVGVDVAQQDRRPVDGIDDDVDLAVVEEVAEGRAASGDDIGEPGADDRLDVLEDALLWLLAGHIVEEQRALGPACAPVVLVHLRVDVAVDLE